MVDAEGPVKILIADSDTYVLMTLQAIMGSLGHHVVAESIADGLATLIGVAQPTLVVIDPEMAGLTAAELSRVLLERARQGFGVALYSAMKGEDLEAVATELGAYACIDKSASADVLLSELQGLLDRMPERSSRISELRPHRIRAAS